MRQTVLNEPFAFTISLRTIASAHRGGRVGVRALPGARSTETSGARSGWMLGMGRAALCGASGTVSSILGPLASPIFRLLNRLEWPLPKPVEGAETVSPAPLFP